MRFEILVVSLIPATPASFPVAFLLFFFPRCLSSPLLLFPPFPISISSSCLSLLALNCGCPQPWVNSHVSNISLFGRDQMNKSSAKTKRGKSHHITTRTICLSSIANSSYTPHITALMWRYACTACMQKHVQSPVCTCCSLHKKTFSARGSARIHSHHPDLLRLFPAAAKKYIMIIIAGV